MTLIDDYWYDNPDVRFSTFLNVISEYCHPEAYDEAYEDLIERARRADPMTLKCRR